MEELFFSRMKTESAADFSSPGLNHSNVTLRKLNGLYTAGAASLRPCSFHEDDVLRFRRRRSRTPTPLQSPE